MQNVHNGIICGGHFDGVDYSPKLEECGGTKRLTFKVLFTRGGNTKKNFDIFEMKCFGKLAEQYFKMLKDDTYKGTTVSVQFSLENNSNGFMVYEFICSFIRFDIGEEIYLPNMPACAAKNGAMKQLNKKEETSTSVVPKEYAKEDVSKPMEHTKEIAKTNIVEVTPQKYVPIDDELLHTPPIHVVELVKLMLISQEDGKEPTNVVGLIAKSDNSSVGKVVSQLSQDEDYLAFRDLMG